MTSVKLINHSSSTADWNDYYENISIAGVRICSGIAAFYHL